MSREIGSWGVPFEKAESGFPPRTREGEGVSFDDFNPENKPIALINFILDKVDYGEGNPMTRPQRQTMEAIRDGDIPTDAEAKASAAEVMADYNKSALRLNAFHRASALVLEIVEIYGRILNAEEYRVRVQSIVEKINDRLGPSPTEETPVPRFNALEFRQVLASLKNDLARAGIIDQ